MMIDALKHSGRMVWPGLMLAAFLTGGVAAAQAAGPTDKGAPAAPAAAAPQAEAGGSDPQVTTATYQDWLVRCVTPSATAKLCEATQTLQVQAQGQQPGGPIALIALGRLAADAPVRVVVQLPAGVWLPAGAKLQPGEKAKPVALEFKRCLQGCFAEAELDKGAEQALRTASGAGSLQFEDGARRAVTLPFSLKGLAPALEAALKTR
ncbi:invasion associated locus B family protein [Methylorubrum zatmanii]